MHSVAVRKKKLVAIESYTNVRKAKYQDVGFVQTKKLQGNDVKRLLVASEE